MPRTRQHHVLVCGILALAAWAGGGCSFFTGEQKPQARPVEFSVESPYAGVKTIAVAPAINLSGSRDFDSLAVADALFVELQQVRDLNILPVNKTLMAMNRLGMRNIDDAHAAQRLAEALGADALVIPAITAYDPYNPPTVGMVLQLYTPAMPQPAAHMPVRFDTVKSNVVGVSVSVDEANGPAQLRGENADPRQPVAQVSAVFNANNQTVLRELRDFSMGRTQYDSALLDQKFLVDSDAYMRFVCHAMVRRLMDVERTRAADR